MTRQLSLHGSVSTDTSKPPSAASSRVLARSLSNASDEAKEEQQRKESERDKVWVAARSDPVGPRRCEECISTTCAAASWRPRKGVSGSIAVVPASAGTVAGDGALATPQGTSATVVEQGAETPEPVHSSLLRHRRASSWAREAMQPSMAAPKAKPRPSRGAPPPPRGPPPPPARRPPIPAPEILQVVVKASAPSRSHNLFSGYEVRIGSWNLGVPEDISCMGGKRKKFEKWLDNNIVTDGHAAPGRPWRARHG